MMAELIAAVCKILQTAFFVWHLLFLLKMILHIKIFHHIDLYGQISYDSDVELVKTV